MPKPLAIAFLVTMSAFMAAACFDHILITGPSQSQGQNSGGPGASPSPSPSPTGQAPYVVKAGLFPNDSEACPSGIQRADGQREIRVGCKAPATCTPELQDGSDAVVPLGITKPDFFGLVSGDAITSSATENAFNIDLYARSPGVVRLKCVVRGVVGENDITAVP
jgi:hypothetical protein